MTKDERRAVGLDASMPAGIVGGLGMTPRQRTLLGTGIGVALALYLGATLADGGWAPAVLGAAVIVAFIAERFLGWSAEAVLLAGGLLGYILGNRGFAQIMPPGVPLLYAEGALAAGAALLFTRSALNRRLPLRVDALNLTLVLWIVLSGVRVLGDLRVHGIGAARDFALVYYAGFFFLAQRCAETSRARTLIAGALTVALAAVFPLFLAEELWPGFFYFRLRVLGVPLVMHKPDLVSVYAGMGAVWFYFLYRRQRRVAWVALFALSLGAIAFITTRAVLVALAAVAGAAALLGERRLARWLAIAGVAGAAALLVVAAVSEKPFTESKAYSLYEHARSLVDWSGKVNYASEEAGSSGDNNQFRLVWWRMVVEETLDRSPWFGLGFGHDLAARFVQTYNPQDAETFTARSPHNVLLTIFARTGVVGLTAFLLVVVSAMVATWRIRRRVEDPRVLGLWMAAWVVFISACFGVVLEGPMGAVIFWTVLGLAHGWAQVALEQAAGAATDAVSVGGVAGLREENAVPPLQPAGDSGNR